MRTSLRRDRTAGPCCRPVSYVDKAPGRLTLSRLGPLLRGRSPPRFGSHLDQPRLLARPVSVSSPSRPRQSRLRADQRAHRREHPPQLGSATGHLKLPKRSGGWPNDPCAPLRIAAAADACPWMAARSGCQLAGEAINAPALAGRTSSGTPWLITRCTSGRADAPALGAGLQFGTAHLARCFKPSKACSGHPPCPTS